MTPVVTAPVAAAIAVVVAATIAPVVTARIGTAGIAGDIADLTIEAASAIVEATIPATIDPVGPAVSAILDPVGAAIPAVFDLIRPAIATVFDPVGARIGAAVDSDSGTIAPAPVQLTRADIAALFDPVSPLFAATVDGVGAPLTATVDLTGARFAAAINAVGTRRAIGALGCLNSGSNVAAEASASRTLLGIGPDRRLRTLSDDTLGSLSGSRARGSGPFGPGCVDSRSTLRSGPFGLHPRRAAAIFGADLLAFGSRLRPGFAATILIILRSGRGGGK